MLAQASKVILAVSEEGQPILFNILTKICLDVTSSHTMRFAAVTLMGVYCKESPTSYSGHLSLLIHSLLRLYNDPVLLIRESAAQAFDSLTNVLHSLYLFQKFSQFWRER
jgi:hypothetical protein